MRRILLIDGPSGSGKTSLAEHLAQVSGWELVHLDDFYPGWAGLAEASAMVARDVLDPRRPGFWRWDWVADCRVPWVPLDPQANVIVEGVGSVTAANRAAARRIGAVRTLRLSAPLKVRRMRALTRDPGFVAYWDMWAAQEAEYYAGPGGVAADFEIVVNDECVLPVELMEFIRG